MLAISDYRRVARLTPKNQEITMNIRQIRKAKLAGKVDKSTELQAPRLRNGRLEGVKSNDTTYECESPEAKSSSSHRGCRAQCSLADWAKPCSPSRWSKGRKICGADRPSSVQG